MKIYFIALLVVLSLITLFEEAYVKGTGLNIAIRHYFGMTIFDDFAAADPLKLTYDKTIPICDHEKMTPKIFFNEYVSKDRPCLFKGYGR